MASDFIKALDSLPQGFYVVFTSEKRVDNPMLSAVLMQQPPDTGWGTDLRGYPISDALRYNDRYITNVAATNLDDLERNLIEFIARRFKSDLGPPNRPPLPAQMRQLAKELERLAVELELGK